jgi:hypothetical protein
MLGRRLYDVGVVVALPPQGRQYNCRPNRMHNVSPGPVLEMSTNTLYGSAPNRRCLTRLMAAGMLAAALLLAGCASEGLPEKPSLPFGKNARDESIRKQAQSDSFPTAQQAGL